MKPLLRAPGSPRKGDPRIPGFGVCSHPHHGTVVWLVEGEIVDGKSIGRCARHANATPVEDLEEELRSAWGDLGFEVIDHGVAADEVTIIRRDVDLDVRIHALDRAWEELQRAALDEESEEIHRKLGAANLESRINDREASVALSPIVSDDSSSSDPLEELSGPDRTPPDRDAAPITPIDRGTGTMDDDAARAQEELGVTLQELRRAVYETQAEIEGVRESVADLLVKLEQHTAGHEQARRSWRSRLGELLGESPDNDRRPW